MNLNKVFLIGNLTRDPDMRTLPSGKPVVSFGIATNRIWNDQSGKRQTTPEFHNIVAFGRLAEIAKQYLTKGKMVFVEGRIQTRTWDGQDGSKKSRTEVIIEQMQLGPRGTPGSVAPSGDSLMEQKSPTGSDGTVGTGGETVETIQYPQDEGEINPDDIPF
ncbi:MAG: single-stranded DNA-binding protein [Patescibacteria group bacterium]